MTLGDLNQQLFIVIWCHGLLYTSRFKYRHKKAVQSTRLCQEKLSQVKSWVLEVPVGGALSFQMKILIQILISLYSVFVPAMTSLLCTMVLYFQTEQKNNHYYTKHIMPKSIIRKRSFPRGSYKESIDKLVLLLVSYRENQRFYYIIMYRCHLLYCWWPVMGQVSADHTYLYKQIMNQ